ncbi:hypothetical protein GTA08_BOTSDO03034 [Neofusicoccum parvum]|nr:hypothetical protein GTA08_BOTSDO03034 [Neofusicoccum parvum]
MNKFMKTVHGCDTSDTSSERSLPAPVVHNVDRNFSIPGAAYAIAWIAASSGVILFNKWILNTAQFEFPLFLTTWHLLFAAAMTQFLAYCTKLLDSRYDVPMTRQMYLKAIMPIAVFYSLSLVSGNVAYLYLSVSFIQMLKATNALATLVASWALGVSPANLSALGKVSIIVIGVIIASFGEIKLDILGFFIQMAGIVFEAIRLVMVQKLLSSSEFQMDPLVSLYYFAPACALINGVATLVWEVPKLAIADIYRVGPLTLLANACVAFLLNVSVVFLIGKTSAVVLTLCGVLKDILLVFASIIMFGDPVTLTQVFGYSISLCGLVYHKIGSETFYEVWERTKWRWTASSGDHSLLKRLITFSGVKSWDSDGLEVRLINESAPEEDVMEHRVSSDYI